MPVIGHDSHLPALSSRELSAEAVRGALIGASSWAPPLRGDGGWFAAQGSLKPAAVLVGLVQRTTELHVLLTRRTVHLRAHAGQVSFPGGRLEVNDATAAHGALREAAEEIGLLASNAEVVGEMPAYLTVTGFEVRPVVALITPPMELRPDPQEVDDIFEVPLSFLMNPSHHRRHELQLPDRTRQFLSMPWHGRGWSGKEQEYFIWGATAAMLRNLYHLLAR